MEAIGDIADYFTDGYWGDAVPDGNLLLIPESSFNRYDLATAVSAGGKVVEGYEFPYPRSVTLRKTRGWCGFVTAGVGYALTREIAEAVCAASFAARDEEEED